MKCKDGPLSKISGQIGTLRRYFYPMAWRPPGTLPHTLSSNTLVWKAWARRKEPGARNQLRLGYWFRVNSVIIGWMASVSRAVSERSAAWVNARLTWMQEPQGSAEHNCLWWLLQRGRKAHAMHGRWKLGAGGRMQNLREGTDFKVMPVRPWPNCSYFIIKENRVQKKPFHNCTRNLILR